MDPEDWKRIEQLYHSTLDLDPSKREAFLVTACAGDASLFTHVKRLLDHHDEAEDFFKVTPPRLKRNSFYYYRREKRYLVVKAGRRSTEP